MAVLWVSEKGNNGVDKNRVAFSESNC